MPQLSRRLALIAALGTALLAADAGSAQVAPPISGDDMTLGNPAAKVTVIEYASTACPHCAHWNADIWPAFKAKHVDTGKVRFVYREFITSPAQVAVAGPVLARCAGKAEYFPMLDAAFKAQEAIYAAGNIQPLLTAAEALGMSADQIKTCLTTQANIDAMQARAELYATRDKIEGTPTFVVNGKKIDGHELADLDAAIAAAN